MGLSLSFFLLSVFFPFLCISSEFYYSYRKLGRACDGAPTVLTAYGPPRESTYARVRQARAVGPTQRHHQAARRVAVLSVSLWVLLVVLAGCCRLYRGLPMAMMMVATRSVARPATRSLPRRGEDERGRKKTKEGGNRPTTRGGRSNRLRLLICTCDAPLIRALSTCTTPR